MKIQGTFIPTLKQSHSVKPFHNNQRNVPKDCVEIRFGNNDDELDNLRADVAAGGDPGGMPSARDGLWNKLSKDPSKATDEELHWLSTGDSPDLQEKVRREKKRRQQDK